MPKNTLFFLLLEIEDICTYYYCPNGGSCYTDNFGDAKCKCKSDYYYGNYCQYIKS